VLSQRIALFGWLEEKHLDVPEGEGSKGFLMFAQQGEVDTCLAVNNHWKFLSELLKINHYKAPRDKLICILNCCKVIFGQLYNILGYLRCWQHLVVFPGLIRHLHKEEGADSFVPVLIFVVLKANPEHLLSNVEWVSSHLTSRPNFWLNMDSDLLIDFETPQSSKVKQATIFRALYVKLIFLRLSLSEILV